MKGNSTCREQKIPQGSCPGKDRLEAEGVPVARSVSSRDMRGKNGEADASLKLLNRRMPNGTYGGVRGRLPH